MPTQRSAGRFLRLMLSAHRTFLILGVIFAVAIALVVAMASSYAFGSTRDAMAPLHTALPLVVRSAIGALVGSTQADAERFAGPKFHRVVTVLVVLTSLLGAGLMMLGGAIGVLHPGGEIEADLVLSFARSTLACAGVGLLSAAILGSNYSWLFPVLTFAFLTNYGYDVLVNPYPWNILTAPNSIISVALALILFFVGILAYRKSGYWKTRLGKLGSRGAKEKNLSTRGLDFRWEYVRVYN